MAADQFSRSPAPRVQARARHAWRQGLRRHFRQAHDRHRANRLVDRAAFRNRLRKVWPQQVAVSARDAFVLAAAAWDATAEFVLSGTKMDFTERSQRGIR